MSNVSDFYDGKCLFITGATGFLGKVLVEKLLRSCPGIETIYILVRCSEGQFPSHRLVDLLSSKVFHRLRQENRQLLLKLKPLSGDICCDNLGLSENDIQELINKVSIVIHSAATIRFDEPIDRAISINVVATHRVLQLCHLIKNIKAFVHVSTAYCALEKQQIKEVPCEYPYNVSEFIRATKWMNQSLLSSQSRHLLEGRPTSYHFTKALAESLLLQEYNNVPIAIVRPSIITAAWKEPNPGWIDNFYGPSGYLVSTGKGVLRTLHGHKDKICDMIPVDVVANTIIAAAWCVGTNSVIKPPVVYNCTSGSLNPITWGQVRNISQPLLIKYPSMQMFRYPDSAFHSNRLVHEIYLLIEHNIPAFLIDILFRATGHKPILSQVYTKVHRALKALEHFTTNEWTFETDNFTLLMESLNQFDKQMFSMNLKEIDWHEYMQNYVLGVRQYLLQEDPSTLPKARMRLKRLYIATQIIKIGFLVTVTAQLARRKSLLRSLYNTFSKLALRL